MIGEPREASGGIMKTRPFCLILMFAAFGWSQIQLTGYKSGNDLIWQWSTLGNPMTLCRDTVPQFAHPITILRDTSNISYTYSGAVGNGMNFETFLVFDSVEDSASYDSLPPVPPEILSLSPSAIKIGDVLTIDGSGFSSIPEENIISYENGEWTVADTATPTQITATVPQGAVSGEIVVCSASLCTDPVYQLDICETWNNPRSIYYVAATDEYYFGGFHSSGNRVKSYKYSDLTKHWEGTERQSVANSYICAQGTDSAGRYHCGRSTFVSGDQTEWLDTTNASSTLAACFAVGAVNYKVYGMATDPILNYTYAVAGNSDSSVKAIRKLNSNCQAPMPDDDFGNYNNTIALNTFATPAVDKDSFLYMPEMTFITKIDPVTEERSIYASGFSDLYGLAYNSLSAGDKGLLLAWEWTPGKLKAMDMNQATPTVFTVYQAANRIRSASFGYEKHQNQGPANTRVIIFEELGRPKILKSPPIEILPTIELNNEPLKVWISKQNPADTWANEWQTGDARAKVTVRMTDNVPRTFYARIVDPKDTAPYAPAPGTPLFTCNQAIPGNACDNKDPTTFSSYGPGTFTANGSQYYQAPSSVTQASLEFNLTHRYAGDNYQIEILDVNADPADPNSKVLVRSPIFTAWKRISIEKDRMFRQGGLIFGDISPGMPSILVEDWANLPACSDTPGASPCFQIVIFDATDADHSAELSIDRPYVSHITPFGSNFKQLWLVHEDMSPYETLGHYYYSPYPDFSNGFSAGIGVIGSWYYDADMGSVAQAFNDGFVSFHVFPEGVGAIPYLPQSFFDGADANKLNFHQKWFKKKKPSSGNPSNNDPQNYFHLIGASASTGYLGYAYPDSDAMFIYILSIESQCAAYGCISAQLANFIRETVSHEFGHGFRINSCDPGGHCLNNGWCGEVGGACPSPCTGGLEWCLMNDTQTPFNDMMCENTDGIARFDCSELSANPACPVSDCSNGISIRTNTDPE